jgi:hypothetical protein
VFELRDGLWQNLGEKAARSIAVGPAGRVYLNDGNYHVFEQVVNSDIENAVRACKAREKTCKGQDASGLVDEVARME